MYNLFTNILTLQNWVSRVSRIPGGFFEKLGGIPKILTSHREADRCAYQNLVFCMQYEIGDKDSWRLEMLIFGKGGTVWGFRNTSWSLVMLILEKGFHEDWRGSVGWGEGVVGGGRGV